MTLLLAASLFFTEPAVLSMPQADGYLVTDSDGKCSFEDRYDPNEIWISRAVFGRWEDDAGRSFVLARLGETPRLHDDEPTLTRTEYVAGETAPEAKDEASLALAVDRLSPVEPARDFLHPRQLPHGIKDARYYEGTNTAAIVCAFLPERSDVWWLATWSLAEGDDQDECRRRFEEFFWPEWRDKVRVKVEAEEKSRVKAEAGRRRGKTKPPSERELLRRDAAHSVAAYPAWHATDAKEFSILDDLGDNRDFIVALTNELPKLRARFSEVVPTPIDATNSLAVARIFATRGEYLDAAGTDMVWTAAYWMPSRRELVAYMPPAGSASLMKTFRHESFHQYLSYATAMLSAAPWLNEGYAQYFEDEQADELDLGVSVEEAAKLLPGVMLMDYPDFYAGSDEQKHVKYRLAWSVAYFLEKGAPKVPFEPFKNLKRDYFAALLRTHSIGQATMLAFGTPEKLEDFVSEWKKFWLAM